ncbi:hypothetical protein QYM36_016014 [Artemia franciscana]|nr:hypothetical protein QYM36_016014 [Artemia franciscana]
MLDSKKLPSPGVSSQGNQNLANIEPSRLKDSLSTFKSKTSDKKISLFDDSDSDELFSPQPGPKSDKRLLNTGIKSDDMGLNQGTQSKSSYTVVGKKVLPVQPSLTSVSSLLLPSQSNKTEPAKSLNFGGQVSSKSINKNASLFTDSDSNDELFSPRPDKSKSTLSQNKIPAIDDTVTSINKTVSTNIRLPKISSSDSDSDELFIPKPKSSQSDIGQNPKWYPKTKVTSVEANIPAKVASEKEARSIPTAPIVKTSSVTKSSSLFDSNSDEELFGLISQANKQRSKRYSHAEKKKVDISNSSMTGDNVYQPSISKNPVLQDGKDMAPDNLIHERTSNVAPHGSSNFQSPTGEILTNSGRGITKDHEPAGSIAPSKSDNKSGGTGQSLNQVFKESVAPVSSDEDLFSPKIAQTEINKDILIPSPSDIPNNDVIGYKSPVDRDTRSHIVTPTGGKSSIIEYSGASESSTLFGTSTDDQTFASNIPPKSKSNASCDRLVQRQDSNGTSKNSLVREPIDKGLPTTKTANTNKARDSNQLHRDVLSNGTCEDQVTKSRGDAKFSDDRVSHEDVVHPESKMMSGIGEEMVASDSSVIDKREFKPDGSIGTQHPNRKGSNKTLKKELLEISSDEDLFLPNKKAVIPIEKVDARLPNVLAAENNSSDEDSLFSESKGQVVLTKSGYDSLNSNEVPTIGIQHRIFESSSDDELFRSFPNSPTERNSDYRNSEMKRSDQEKPGDDQFEKKTVEGVKNDGDNLSQSRTLNQEIIKNNHLPAIKSGYSKGEINCLSGETENDPQIPSRSQQGSQANIFSKLKQPETVSIGQVDKTVLSQLKVEDSLNGLFDSDSDDDIFKPKLPNPTFILSTEPTHDSKVTPSANLMSPGNLEDKRNTTEKIDTGISTRSSPSMQSNILESARKIDAVNDAPLPPIRFGNVYEETGIFPDVEKDNASNTTCDPFTRNESSISSLKPVQDTRIIPCSIFSNSPNEILIQNITISGSLANKETDRYFPMRNDKSTTSDSLMTYKSTSPTKIDLSPSSPNISGSDMVTPVRSPSAASLEFINKPRVELGTLDEKQALADEAASNQRNLSSVPLDLEKNQTGNNLFAVNCSSALKVLETSEAPLVSNKCYCFEGSDEEDIFNKNKLTSGSDKEIEASTVANNTWRDSAALESINSSQSSNKFDNSVENVVLKETNLLVDTDKSSETKPLNYRSPNTSEIVPFDSESADEDKFINRGAEKNSRNMTMSDNKQDEPRKIGKIDLSFLNKKPPKGSSDAKVGKLGSNVKRGVASDITRSLSLRLAGEKPIIKRKERPQSASDTDNDSNAEVVEENLVKPSQRRLTLPPLPPVLPKKPESKIKRSHTFKEIRTENAEILEENLVKPGNFLKALERNSLKKTSSGSDLKADFENVSVRKKAEEVHKQFSMARSSSREFEKDFAKKLDSGSENEENSANPKNFLKVLEKNSLQKAASASDISGTLNNVSVRQKAAEIRSHVEQRKSNLKESFQKDFLRLSDSGGSDAEEGIVKQSRKSFLDMLEQNKKNFRRSVVLSEEFGYQADEESNIKPSQKKFNPIVVKSSSMGMIAGSLSPGVMSPTKKPPIGGVPLFVPVPSVLTPDDDYDDDFYDDLTTQPVKANVEIKQDTPEQKGLSITKNRARINVKRRPMSRKSRIEAARKSAIFSDLDPQLQEEKDGDTKSQEILSEEAGPSIDTEKESEAITDDGTCDSKNLELKEAQSDDSDEDLFKTPLKATTPQSQVDSDDESDGSDLFE